MIKKKKGKYNFIIKEHNNFAIMNDKKTKKIRKILSHIIN